MISLYVKPLTYTGQEEKEESHGHIGNGRVANEAENITVLTLAHYSRALIRAGNWKRKESHQTKHTKGERTMKSVK